MHVTELFMAVPGPALALAIVAALGPGITNCVLALAIVWWPVTSVSSEAKTLSVKEDLFVESDDLSQPALFGRAADFRCLRRP
jgi:peptide/nickel transport system permease protein